MALASQLKAVAELHRKAQWRLDFVAAENSMGFHAPQEGARILGESIDYSRQAQLAAQPAVMHQAPVFAGVDDADHGGEQLRQQDRAQKNPGTRPGLKPCVAQGREVGCWWPESNRLSGYSLVRFLRDCRSERRPGRARHL